MKTLLSENMRNNNEAEIETEACIKFCFLEYGKFLVYFISNRPLESDLRQVRKLFICKGTLTLNKGYVFIICLN